MEAAQCAELPDGAVTVSCSAPLGTGGLGRHVQEIIDALGRRGSPATAIVGPAADGAPPPSRRLPGGGADIWGLASLAERMPGPLPPGLRALASASGFDRHAARRLPAAGNLIAFNGQALAQLGVARRARYGSLGLVSANSHMRRVARQHELARKRYPLEESWTRWMLRRNLAEYDRADVLYVASRYIRESFIEEGFSEERLAWFPLTPDPRFDCGNQRSPGGSFEIVYSGSLTVHKGVPLLIDAFRRLSHADMRLVLVGGWSTRGMRRFVQEACAADPRISSAPGDPLQALKTAALCVHPAYEDGFAYAPAEALVCGVPVLVSEDTGMKDMIDSPALGLVLRTGDLDALTEAIDAAYRGEILGG
ncbi:MAG: glycosyltransferase family 4 protein [Solirubrobacteraceae bacterium]